MNEGDNTLDRRIDWVGHPPYYQADGLGSVTSFSDGSGSLVATYTYDSFGKQVTSFGSLTNPFQYTGREFDSETNLYFYRARYYEQAGRFLSEDLLGFRAGVNFYPYVGNDPTNSSDPSGLLKVCCRPAVIHSEKNTIACHCFIVLSDAAGTTYGGYKRRGILLVPNKNDKDDKPIPPGSTCTDITCDKEKEIEKNYNTLPKWVVYGSHGRTSNTVAATLLKQSGIPFKFPACAIGSDVPLEPPVYPRTGMR